MNAILVIGAMSLSQCANGYCPRPAVTVAPQVEYRVTATLPRPVQQVQPVVVQERRGFFKKLFKRRNR